MMPAQMPADSWSPPSCGDTVSTDEMSKEIGRAPYFSTFARSRASASVKVPVICAWPPGIGCDTLGVEMVSPSSTIANRFWPSPRAEMFWVALRNLSPPSPVNFRLTCHWKPPCGIPALASARSVPFMIAGPSRYLNCLLRSQENSGLFGSSVCLSPHLNVANAACVAASGV